MSGPSRALSAKDWRVSSGPITNPTAPAPGPEARRTPSNGWGSNHQNGDDRPKSYWWGANHQNGDNRPTSNGGGANHQSLDIERVRSSRESTPRNYRQPENKGAEEHDTLAIQQAIDEGRPLWIGNLTYTVTRAVLRKAFEENGFETDHVKVVHATSTGEDRSYGLVYLKYKTEMHAAIETMHARYVGERRLKVFPGRRSGNKDRDFSGSSQHPQKQRSRQASSSSVPDGGPSNTWTPNDAPVVEGRRVWVGDLPHVDERYNDVNGNVRMLFDGFELAATSGVFTCVPSEGFSNGDQAVTEKRYLFVDFPTAEEANKAVEQRNGRLLWGVNVKVQIARTQEAWQVEKSRLFEELRALP